MNSLFAGYLLAKRKDLSSSDALKAGLITQALGFTAPGLLITQQFIEGKVPPAPAPGQSGGSTDPVHIWKANFDATLASSAAALAALEAAVRADPNDAEAKADLEMARRVNEGMHRVRPRLEE